MRQRTIEARFDISKPARGRGGAITRARLRARFLVRLPILLLAISLAPVLVWAQGEASISGLATDATGSAIPRATIRITNSETGAVRTILTDDSGRYEASLLTVGEYEISAEKVGFSTAMRSVSLVLGQHANVDLTLSVAGVRQTIQVEGAAFAPGVTNADVSGLVNERQVKDLPLNGRSYDQLLTLNPRCH